MLPPHTFIRWKVQCVNLCIYMNPLWYSFSSHHMEAAEKMKWAQIWGSSGETSTSLSFLFFTILIPIYYSLFLHLSWTFILTAIILARIWNFHQFHISQKEHNSLKNYQLWLKECNDKEKTWNNLFSEQCGLLSMALSVSHVLRLEIPFVC